MKILCATDFSEPSRAAETEALALARGLGAEVIYVHVAVQPMLYGEAPFAMGDVTRVYEAQRRWAEDTLRTRAAGTESRGITSRWVLRAGVPFEEIVAAATEEKADMIVIGTHGRSGLNRLLLGSVAERDGAPEARGEVIGYRKR
jgi:nucleotide-binding universal stress UspA family protein